MKTGRCGLRFGKTADDTIRITFEILRRKSADAPAHWETYPFETEDRGETAATALDKLNRRLVGNGEEPIRWECSCLQKKCGACAMVINGKPRLACDTFLRDFRKEKKLVLEPLRKFPVVADLMVDRSIMRENLRIMELWQESESETGYDVLQEKSIDAQGGNGKYGTAQSEKGQIGKARSGKFAEKERKQQEFRYEASRCLQCGCCLEVCPNFCAGEEFFGAACFVPTARLITSLPMKEQDKMRRAYLSHVYKGCGKSLACAAVCPAGIDTELLLSRSNRAALWRRQRHEG